MRKSLRIFLAVLLIIIIVALLGIFSFNRQFQNLLKDIDKQYGLMENIDMAKIQDGEYTYRYGKIPVFADLKVKVKDHKITSIVMMEQSSGPDHEGLETIDRILSKQQAKVDAVTGATISSKVIMIATYKALTENNK